jgi:hypothetical protein
MVFLFLHVRLIPCLGVCSRVFDKAALAMRTFLLGKMSTVHEFTHLTILCNYICL